MTLSKREWKVLRDAVGFGAYVWSRKTCLRLLGKGLMAAYGYPPCRSFVLTDAGHALIAEADELQRRILEQPNG